MPTIRGRRKYVAASVGVIGLLLLLPALCNGGEVEYTNLRVLVKSADNDKPIFQARLTLQFRMPGGVRRFGRSKLTTYSAKTDKDGRYTFVNIPKGTFRLFVTAEDHQSYGKELELEEDNQLFEVKLRKPQPVL